MENADPKTTELTLTFSESAADALREIQRLGRFRTLKDAMESVIGTALFLQTKRYEGWRVLLEKDRRYREVVHNVE